MCPPPESRDLDALLAEGPWLRQLARGLVGQGVEADDLVQDTWLASLRRPPGLRGPELRQWLARVLRNAAAGRHRSEASRLRREQRRAVTPVTLPSEDALERAELQNQLLLQLGKLSHERRQVLILRYYEGLSHAEISRQLAVNESTVRKRLQRATEQLRNRLRLSCGPDWRAQCIQLFQLSAPTVLSPTVWGGGLGIMSMKVKWLTVAVVTAGLTSWFVWSEADDPAPSSQTDLSSAAVESGDEEVFDPEHASLGVRRTNLEPTRGTTTHPDTDFFGWFGYVFDPEGRPIAGALVRVGGTETEVRTNEAGEFRLPWAEEHVWRAGQHTVFASHPGWVPDEAREIPPARPAHSIDLQLTEGKQVTVRVLSAEDQRPLTGIPVAFQRGEYAGTAVDVARSQPDGRVSFVTDAPGRHLLWVEDNPQAWLERTHEWIVPPIAEPEYVIRVRLYPQRARFVIRDANTKLPLEAARMLRPTPDSQRRDAEGSRRVDWEPLLDSDGVFEWQREPNDDPIHVAAMAPGYQASRFFPSRNDGSIQFLDLRSQSSQAIEVRRRGRELTRAVSIRWSYRLPVEIVPDAARHVRDHIQWVAPVYVHKGELTTDALGRAQLPIWRPGRDDSYHPRLSLTITDGVQLERQWTDLDPKRLPSAAWIFELEPSRRRLQFLVLDSASRPLPGADVTLSLRPHPTTRAGSGVAASLDANASSAIETPLRSVRTDEEGLAEFLIPAHREFRWYVQCGHARQQAAQWIALEDADEALPHRVEIVFAESSRSIVGRVRPWDGWNQSLDLRNLRVEAVESATGRSVCVASVSKQGDFALLDLEPGIYTVGLRDLPSAPTVQAATGTEGLELPLPPVRSLLVHSRDARTGRPLNRCQLDLYVEAEYVDGVAAHRDGDLFKPVLDHAITGGLLVHPDYALYAIDLSRRARVGLVWAEADLQPARELAFHFEQPERLEGLDRQSSEVEGLLWAADPTAPAMTVFLSHSITYGEHGEFVWKNAPRTTLSLTAVDEQQRPIGVAFQVEAGDESRLLRVDLQSGSVTEVSER